MTKPTKPCGICSWIKELPTSPFLVKELETGYVVISKFQYYKGYVLFLSKTHATELHQLPTSQRQLFLNEMSQVAEAVYKAVQPAKMNYELLGNEESHLHWHLVPRYTDDSNAKRPIWIIDKNIRESEEYFPTLEELATLKKKLLDSLN